jgi:tetratricopeptide (TPR) repeat protein
MPRISLRTYEKDIEEMIEQNQLNEAVAHCKHILQFFPKNISTYRILGKSFLEAKQYKETADIFTRVLTVYPDDFIAHAGMSIVRELENDLDAAIWHMQMAFDSQPSNIAIQEELKRLFDLRDGTHPEKIRLTRGALVRMYARGELYQQAIDEIKSALSEEPKRIDLQVFLAKMYFLSGDQEEALAIAERLISDFPFCYELNRILVSILKNLGSGKKAETYTARLVELNPYQAFVNDIYSSEDQVPDEKVVIDKLSDVASIASSIPTTWSEPAAQWQPSAPSKEQEPSAPFDFPGTAELKFEPETDVNTEQTQTVNETPQKEETDMSASNTPFTDPAPVGDDSDNNIPEWMRNSGWIPSNGEEMPSEEKDAPIPAASETDPADIPDWLKSLSQEESQSDVPPTPQSESTEDTSPSAASETSAWMNNVIEEYTPAKGTGDSDLPDWLKNFETDDKAEPVTKDDLPDWLNALKSDEAVSAPSVNPFETQAQDEIPGSEDAAALPQNEESEVDPLANLFASDASTWQPAEDLLKEIPVNAQAQEAEQPVPSAIDDMPQPSQTVVEETEPVDPNATISQETENDLLSWLRDLKPAEGEDTAAPVAETVPEESLDNEDQRYDFAAQLERLQNINEEPASSVEEKQPLSDDAVSENDGDDEIPLVQSQVELEPAEPASSLVNTEMPSQSEPTGFEEEPEKPAVQESSDLPTWEPAVANDDLSGPADVSTEQSLPDLELLRRETEANPDDFYSWQQLGDAYAKAGNLVDALAAYNKAESIIIKSK